VGLLVALFPVSLTALAPLEIAARDSYVVAAPIDGVIEELAVAPNAAVREGQLLLRFSDTVLRNKFIIAEREVSIADARLKKIMQQSFSDIRGRHEVGLAQTELKLKRAERDFARDILTRAELKAGRTGVALLGDPRDLIGKPVATGERIMEIADPRRVEIRIDVGVSDSALLETGARVKAFLDSDPLRPREGRIVRADYQARVRDGNALTVRAVAEFDAPAADPPRLGLRGTAQVYGTTVPLIYYLLKRPLAALRQWVGV
jgi:multidrug efflux pump subunit AcrA (membrane-fusion protein)